MNYVIMSCFSPWSLLGTADLSWSVWPGRPRAGCAWRSWRVWWWSPPPGSWSVRGCGPRATWGAARGWPQLTGSPTAGQKTRTVSCDKTNSVAHHHYMPRYNSLICGLTFRYNIATPLTLESQIKHHSSYMKSPHIVVTFAPYQSSHENLSHPIT